MQPPGPRAPAGDSHLRKGHEPLDSAFISHFGEEGGQKQTLPKGSQEKLHLCFQNSPKQEAGLGLVTDHQGPCT